jgi:hypothetical protein
MAKHSPTIISIMQPYNNLNHDMIARTTNGMDVRPWLKAAKQATMQEI